MRKLSSNKLVLIAGAICILTILIVTLFLLQNKKVNNVHLNTTQTQVSEAIMESVSNSIEQSTDEAVLKDQGLIISSIQAGLSIELPDYFAMTETEETAQYPEEVGLEEYLKGQVVFTKGEYTEGYENRIIVSYAKPVIYGKGGSCVDENGDPSYEDAVVVGKQMQVCKRGFTMSAAYINNPNQEIEYVISIYADNQEVYDIFMDAVSNKLKFI